jgi:hypothetical protein
MIKKTILKKLLIGTACMTAVLGMSVTTFAEDTTQPITNTGEQTATVNYDKPSTFSVSIPKTITLGSNGTAEYTVSVTGDIYGNEQVTVIPDASFAIKNAEGKSDITATISQDKTNWSYDIDSNAIESESASGNITAANLTAGVWNGTFNFTISKSEK